MAIVSVNEQHSNREGANTLRGRSATREFIVKTNSIADDHVAVLAAGAIPDPGDAHPNDSRAIALSCTARPIDGDAFLWRVTVPYNTQTNVAGFMPDNFSTTVNFNQTPTSRPPQVSFTTLSEDEEVRLGYDINGFQTVPVVNSAGQSFDPPVAIQRPLFVIRVVKNQASFDPVEASTYTGAVNSDVWVINNAPLITVQPGLARMSISAATTSESGGFYWSVTYEAVIDPNGWVKKVLDQGLGKLGTGGQIEVAKDPNSTAYTSPINLDGSGGILAPAASPVFLPFKFYPELPFTTLGIFA